MTERKNNSIDFLSRDCKKNIHHDCGAEWLGLGVQVHCSCECHIKKEKVSCLVVGPLANTIQETPSSVGGSLE